MNETPQDCPKCQGKMLRGYIPDFSYGASFVSSWHEGEPQKSFWRGTTASHKKGLPIRAFRCAGCGYLEFYADRLP
jgi:hypothetical protein